MESFVFYRSFREAVAEMNDENKLATLLAICDYALDGTEPDLKDPMSRAVFAIARPLIESNREKRQNGKKGGRPSKKPEVPEPENHRFPESESNENENEPESENEPENESGNEPGKPAGKPPTRRKYGQYGWVRLTVSDYNCLLNELGEAEAERCIAYVDESAQSSGNKNRWRDWKLVIRRCHRDGWGLSPQQKDAPPPPPRQTGRLELDENGEEVVRFD